jgi:hypothetical protein
MITVVAIDAQSPHLETIKELGCANKATLGFLPDGAFDERAAAGHILPTLDGADCVGYVLYRIVRDRVAVTDFCISHESQGRGIACLMLQHLFENQEAPRHNSELPSRLRRQPALAPSWLSLGQYHTRPRRKRQRVAR